MAKLRGVDVRILFPKKIDHITVHFAAFFFIPSLAALGIKFYRYTHGFIHQKVCLVDEDISSIGSMNLDVRSGRLNFEASVFVYDQAFANQVEQMLLIDFKSTENFDEQDYNAMPWYFKLMAKICNLFSPIL